MQGCLLQTREIRADGVMRERQGGYVKLHLPGLEAKLRREASTQWGRGHLCDQWSSVWVVSPGKLWQRWWRLEAEPLITSWQDNNVPCCLFVFYTFLQGYSALRAERTLSGEVMFCMIVKTVCSRSSIFDAHYLFSFWTLLLLTSIIRSVAMHAFVW